MGLNFNPSTISPDAITRLLMQGGNPASMFSGDPSQATPPPGAPGTPSPTASPSGAPPSGTLAQNMQPQTPTFGPAMGSTEDLENRGLASATTRVQPRRPPELSLELLLQLPITAPQTTTPRIRMPPKRSCNRVPWDSAPRKAF